MNFSQEQLEEIESMATLFLPPDDIAINIGVDPDEFTELINIKSGPGYQAFFKGWMKTEIELRQSILSSALNGSSPAQQMMLQYRNTAAL
jgi:hypothetical protein